MISFPPTFSDVEKAAERIAPFAEKTPVLTCSAINEMAGAELFFKCENFQKVGAFKFRGACNVVFSLTDDEGAKGVATHSSGNHAAALALAGKLRGISVHVVMPSNAPENKQQAVAGYGADITFCEPTLDARESTLKKIISDTGAIMIHPYNDYGIIAGQGTAAFELISDYPDLDTIVAPVGGGGLISGTCIAAKGMKPDISIIGSEPQGADDAFQSLEKGEIVPQIHPQTIADGLLTSLGDKTFPIIQKHVSQILTVSENGIINAMRTIWERMNIIIEPSAAVVLGALLEHPEESIGDKIGLILSGGNANLKNLPW
ncbi:MAG: pyridoxal-phosphate dependent enzyme [Candidatus Marinimicrobia bacterium]|nr:pyridoxal-phosphate dependent enzyme [Candidatus Neomarinimicrobiota bacterium]